MSQPRIITSNNPLPLAHHPSLDTYIYTAHTSANMNVQFDPSLLANVAGKTVLTTGGANGIGAATVSLFNSHGATVIIADLEHTRPAAESLIATLTYPDKALYLPANTLNWQQMTSAFNQTVQRFGRVDIVIANAGVMESNATLDFDDVDEDGNLRESVEAFKVIDVNLKGTLNSTFIPNLSCSKCAHLRQYARRLT